MKRLFSLFILAAVVFRVEAESPLPAPIRSAAVFKNGLSAISRVAEPGGRRIFLLGGNMLPGTGTLWFSPSGVTVKRIVREADFKVPVPPNMINRNYYGKKITVTAMFGNQSREFRGTVVTPKLPEPEIPVATYQHPDNENIVMLKLDDGRVVTLNRHAIILVESDSFASLTETVKRKRPFWQVESAQKLDALKIEYIGTGLRWQPSYRADLKSNGRMVLEFAATLDNRLEDLNEVELSLVSGFPNLKFAETQDPMAIFFDPRRVAPENFSSGGNMLMFSNQRAAADGAVSRMGKMELSMAESAAFSAPVEDMHFNSIGKVSLKKGETLRIPPQTAEAAYEKLVRWRIPARISESGYAVIIENRNGDGEPMECLKFNNPFEIPLTTAPLEILDRGNVVAQCETEWVNPKSEALVELTKALTVTGKIVEYEAPNSLADKAQKVFSSVEKSRQENAPLRGWIHGRCYRLTDIKGEIEIQNHRRHPAKIRLELNYSGELIKADGDPQDKPADRPGMINPARRLFWELELKAGEKRTLNYRYNVILSN